MGGPALIPTVLGLPHLYHHKSVSLNHLRSSFPTAAVVGSGLSLSLTAVCLAGARLQPRPCSGHLFKWLACKVSSPSPPPSYKWLDYPASYVPPKMDLFSDDIVPLGFSSAPSCPANSEPLERAFEFLRYQHYVKLLGVPSVVESRIRLVTGPTGSRSGRGTSTIIQTTVYGSPSSLAGSPTYWSLDRRLPRWRDLNNGSGGNRGGRGGSSDPPTGGQSAAQRAVEHTRSDTAAAAAPPPPPPPSSSSLEDDYEPIFSRADWDVSWRTFLLGAFIGLLLRKRKQLGKYLRAAFPLSMSPMSPLESDSDMVDQVFQLHSLVHYRNAYIGAYSQLVEQLSSLSTPIFHGFLGEFLVFSAGTLRAFRLLFSIILCKTVSWLAGVVSVFRVTPAVEEASINQCEGTTTAEDDNIVCPHGSEPTVVVCGTTVTESPMEDVLSVHLISRVVDEDVIAVEEKPVVVLPPETSHSVELELELAVEPTDAFFLESGSRSILDVQCSMMTDEDDDGIATTDSVKDPLEAEKDLIPCIVVETSPVEALAPETGSPFNENECLPQTIVEKGDLVPEAMWASLRLEGISSSFPTFNSDSESFFCSTPVVGQPEISPEASVSDTNATPVQTEFEHARRHLDVIIERHIKTVEQRSLDTSMWATPTDQSNLSTSSSSLMDSATSNVNSEGEPNAPAPGRTQQAPGRRRRHRPRGRNRGRGPSAADNSSDVPDWANA